MSKVIAVDFDGTLGFGIYPECGKPNTRLIEWLNWRKAEGDTLILWTCRHGEPLEAAIEWCKDQGLEFDLVNENTPEKIAMYGDTRKVWADYYIDDAHFTSDYIMKKVERPRKARII